MLKLIVGEEGGMAQSASILIKWCTDKTTLEKLKGMGVLNPHILLVNAVGGKEISRLLVPLKQAMEYVRFQTHGRNTIYATIVWADDGKPSTLWDIYATDVLDCNGSFHYNMDSYQGFGFTTTEFAGIDVVIPQELFAKAPPRWLERWVNLWYETKTRDQCHFRKRMIPAFTIQPPLVLLWLILRSLIGVAAVMFWILLIGMRGINLKPLIHPWRQKLEWVWVGRKETIFLRDLRDKKGEEFYQLYILPLMPIVPVILFMFSFLIFAGKLKYTTENAVYSSLYMSMIITGFLVICGAIIDAISHLISYMPVKPLEVKREEYKQKYDGFGYLLCDGGDLPANLNALPPKRRTIHLRFMNLKAKVCKPFAR